MKPRPYVEVYKRQDGLWDWRLNAANGQIVATSGGQGYTERNDALAGWLNVYDLTDYTWIEVRYA